MNDEKWKLIAHYGKKESGFTPLQFFAIRQGIDFNLNIELYAHKEFHHDQMFALLEGLKLRIPEELLKLCAKPEYHANLMKLLIKGFYNGINLVEYLNKGFYQSQLEQILLGYMNNLDYSVYANKQYDYLKMEQIRLALKDNLDVSRYISNEYNHKQIFELRLAQLAGLDIEEMLDSSIPAQKMFLYRCEKIKERDEFGICG